MKKILAMIGAIGLVAASAATVVACGNNKEDQSTAFKTPISDIIPINDLDTIKVVAGQIPTKNQIINAINLKNGYSTEQSSTFIDLKPFDEKQDSDFDEENLVLNPDDFNISNITKNEATVKAANNTDGISDSITVTYTTVDRGIVGIDADLSVNLVEDGLTVSVKEPTEKNLREALKKANPDLIMEEVSVKLIGENTVSLEAIADSTIYNASGNLSFKFIFDPRTESLTDVIKNTNLGPILPRYQSAYDLMNLLAKAKGNENFQDISTRFYRIIKKVSTGSKTFKVTLGEIIQKPHVIKAKYRGKITITYSLNVENNKPGDDDDIREEDKPTLNWNIKNHFLGPIEDRSILSNNNGQLWDLIESKNPGIKNIDKSQFDLIASAESKKWIVIIKPIPKNEIYSQKSKSVFHYVLK